MQKKTAQAMNENRRQFIRYLVTGSVAAGYTLRAESADVVPSVESEDFSIFHRLRDGETFPKPTTARSHELVIIGGGISGLMAAYLTQDRDVLLLEKEPQFGGNARTQELQNFPCSIGTAFIGSSDSSGALARELGIPPIPIANWDGTVDRGVFTPDTWGEGLSSLPYERKILQQFHACRRDLAATEDEARFDDVSLESMIRPYGPEVLRWWTAFCLSTWGGLPSEVAASLALDELRWWAAPDRRDTRATWEGGVGVLSRRLAERVTVPLGERLMDRATVISINSEADRVNVTYYYEGQVVQVEAKAAIIAVPKYVAVRIVHDLPADQLRAMQKIRYTPHCVVNLVFDRPLRRLGYDTWFPGKRFTDVIEADWVQRDRRSATSPAGIVMTCYVPLNESTRESLLSENWCRNLATQVLADFQKSLPDYQVDPIEIHLYRRGHAIHKSSPGIAVHQQVARRPFDRIAFANTDVETMGSSSSGAIRAARRAVDEISRYL
jgi:monoamine oxidase